MVVSSAYISECGTYRYWLQRIWDQSKPILAWAMLNPSKADAEINDPTVRKTMEFSRRWGYGGEILVNMFAFRATDPRELLMMADPVGPNNNRVIRACTQGMHVVAGWGAWADKFPRRRTEMMQLLPELPLCLGTTKSGDPKHPLYLSYKTALIQFDKSLWS